MGQRTAVAGRVRAKSRPAKQPPAGLRLAVFPTELGWIGLLGSDRGVAGLFLGHSTADEARRRAGDAASATFEAQQENAGDFVEDDWNPGLRRKLEQYARGERIDFADCAVALPPLTAFQRKVLDVTRRIPYGRTLTYADLAARAGSPGAARAVGNVMKSNRVPLIIPCHRVVAAGDLGGYSAPQGIELKKRLLQMEAELSEPDAK